MKKIGKRLLIIVLSIVLIVLAGTIAYAATPLSTCQFPDRIVSDVTSDGVQSDPGKQPKDEHVQFVESGDHVRLAYRAYTPANPKAVVIFYHGSGANSAAGYQPIGEELSQAYGIATYLPDIRGHGMSGGPRGDAPSIDRSTRMSPASSRLHTSSSLLYLSFWAVIPLEPVWW
ncbi:alpha/beta hydrolase [Paenibacillus filicis]|uniref:Alpha/beta hydrolase n=1 Tax=Paenibacillus filicis TaxID=669464 RepID=A0ABU9DKD5_9BACL